MNVGYVRLSRDDEKRNYVSIENQKLIITQFAAKQNEVIDKWYEDDNISGYTFERPGWEELLSDLDKITNIYAKDFSRLGRHNAKLLIYLEEFAEQNKRLFVIDDNYDSFESDDDTLGIKTWFNERYVKDISKKIKSALGARQKEGTLLVQVPFGYKRNEKNKQIIEIIPDQAQYVKMIFDLYIQGSGYRKISAYLTTQGIPTPSMTRRELELAEGRNTNRVITTEWSDSMVKDMLINDFYIGVYRQHKRARKTIHGKDKKIPKEEQYAFENHHPAIVDKLTFELVQEIKVKRMKHNYRGNRGQWLGSEIPNPFGSCLYCKDCGSRLTPIKRQTSKRVRKYYVCSTYNTKGRRYCATAHLIEEQELMQDVSNYICLCRNALSEMIATYDLNDFEAEKKSVEQNRSELTEAIGSRKKQLKTLFTQKIKDLSSSPDNAELVTEAYSSLQNDILAQIQGLELKLRNLNDTNLETPNVKKKLTTALDMVDEIIKKDLLDRRDIEVLIDRIEVDENGLPDIKLKYGLSGVIKYSPAEELNRKENQIILSVMKLIREDDRGYTSAKYLSTKLEGFGIKKSKKAILPYIGLMIEDGILEPTENTLKPYVILKTNEELDELIANFQQGIPPVNDTLQVYDQDLHLSRSDRRYASDGI